MAVRTTVTQEPAKGRGWTVALTLLVLFLAALFLRAYWNLDAAQENGKFLLSGGSDPYYEKRAIDSIQANGYHTLIQDPLLNYPYGSINPNPPLYQWSVAIAGQLLSPLFSADAAHGLSALQVSTWWVTEWAPAVYGALTLIPIYFTGKWLFDRRVGLVAAAFWVFSAEAIDVTGLGDSRHYAAVLFFASLAFMFYVKTIEHFRGDGNWVTRWRDGSAVSSGIGRFFRERRVGLGYALLTGISIAAVALMWKGFPYVIGTMFLYAGLQMILDHWKNRDSLGLWLATLLAMLVGMVVAYPYYAEAGVTNFLQASWYIVAAFFIAGLILVPTRDMPTILVFPIALVIAILGVVAAFFVFPDVAQSLLYATVYFKQTALYSTIAEAQTTPLSQMVFGVGPLVFFLALIGWFVVLFTQKRYPARAALFALVLGAVALYMAHSASRFLFNAVPVFAIFGAFMTVWVWDWLDFARVRKALNAGQGFRKGVRPMHVVGVVLIVLLLVVPNAIFAADAAIPPAVEQKWNSGSNSAFLKGFVNQEFGSYGEGFLPGYWEDGLTWLDQWDHNTTNLADRPAFLSWWDYGHWAIYVGNHPTVADNFQNAYEYSANFIISQNETHAVQLLAARLVDLPKANAQQALADAGSKDATGDLALMHKFQYVPDLDLAQSAKLLATLEANTGKKIRYYAADGRMLPYDDPSTPSIEDSSIFYAPVKLAGKNPDDYVTTKFSVASNTFITQEQYNNLLRDPTRRIQATSERLEYQDTFFNSMFYRAYVGRPVAPSSPTQPTLGNTLNDALNAPAPGFGLEHFRLVYTNGGLKILEYYPGAMVTGTITRDGAPQAGVTVTAYDDAGQLLLNAVDPSVRSQLSSENFDVPHASATTDASGHYTVLAPFAMPGGNTTIVASRDGAEVGRLHLAITRDDAEKQTTIPGDFQLRPGTVAGFVYNDTNGNGQYDAANDTPVANEQVLIGGKSATTDASGNFTLSGVSAGRQDVSVNDTQRAVTPQTATVVVRPDETVTASIGLQPKPAQVSGVLYADVNGNGANDGANETQPSSSISFAPDTNATAPNGAKATSVFTQGDGSYSTSLAPGSYVVTATFTAADGTKYAATQTLVVGVGETRTFDVAMTRQ